MSIELLKITHFRNLQEISIECAPHFNLFYGDNGAGKTSIIEAIYYLSLSRSFRTSISDKLIYNNREHFIVFSRILRDSFSIPLGIQKSRQTGNIAHLNEQPVKSIAEISRYLPVQFIGSDSFRILTDGPKLRRQFFDWGLFYTNPDFFNIWKRFLKTLNQRNAALKAKASRHEITAWNHEFVSLSEILHQYRQKYLESFLPFFNRIVSILLDSSTPVQMTYFPGWDIKNDLLPNLEINFYREIQTGHTLVGPHRSDLLILYNQQPAQDILSQGQQKLVSYAMRLAQGLHFHFITNEHPIYLIDDLPSELDAQKRSLVTLILKEINAQVFITGIERDDLEPIHGSDDKNRMFHVKHGGVIGVGEKCFT